MATQPLVSVIMSVFNGEVYLRQAIDSILSQTYTNFELIVIDDCSTDKSWDILSSYNGSRVKLYRNEKNQGLAYSLNRAIEYSIGEYIARMDSDDIAVPERLLTQVNFMQKNPELDFSGSQAYYLLGNNKSNKIFKIPLKEDDIKAKLPWNPPFIHPTVIFRSSFVKNLLPLYDTSFRNAQDYELWERLIFDNRANSANHPAKLIYYRIHSESASREYKQRQTQFADKVRGRFLRRLGINNLSSIKVYNEYINDIPMSAFSLVRLGVTLRKVKEANNRMNLIPYWKLRQLPVYELGVKGIVLYRKLRIDSLFPVSKRIAFYIRALLKLGIKLQFFLFVV
ncbi:glycosyltransferase [Maribellus sp. YY47]|uniref:glycosyltransferase family 2 protein n=1 Tax=Maribellus sp. YY47 TaxID=2929486 RepID=UPI0020012E24|nr:glycosyltransferase [Maribellus sp. YY47]MCK3683748.1 glycosyltransferase [Maribellus sp. YY47]